jgi:nitrite reductase (NADH) large subunit
MAATKLNTPSTEHFADDTCRVVVVGAGPAGVRCAEQLCTNSATLPVTVLGDEPFGPYDRVRLSSFVARELGLDALDSSAGLRRHENLTVLTGRRVVHIDRQHRQVRDRRGDVFRYTKLVLATGSRARVPAIPGVELPGVFVFRTLQDANRLLARQVGSRAAVVIGGGLLGLEAARAMLRFNTRVCVVEHEPRLMFNQLDAAGAARLRARVEALGIEVRVATSVQQIVGPHCAGAVRLKGGEELVCDTVIVATGVAPNVELARAAGIGVGRGIRVNDRMQTSDPDVYAVGECAEHRDKLYGLVGPGIEQAAVAAQNIAGRPAQYLGSLAASSLKVAGCSVFSMGEIQNNPARYSAHVFADSAHYRCINVRHGRIAGAAGVGDWDVARLRAAGLEGRRVWPWQLMRFRATGELWPRHAQQCVAAWPADATVCLCRGVSRGALSDAVAAGAATVDALARATSAATVCGSCKPLVANLLGDAGAGAPILRGLLAASIAGGALAALAYAVSIPYRATVLTPWQWDLLWTDAFYKQVSGFTLLALGLIASLLSLRKRLASFGWARFTSWQLAHGVLGVLACVLLAVHTGLRFGANLNFWLMFCFTGLLVAGAAGGAATALLPRASFARLHSVRRAALWTHILLLWPLPALLGFHVLKGYWF